LEINVNKKQLKGYGYEMKKLLEDFKNLFKKKQKLEEVYYLIFMDNKPQVHFIEKYSMNDIYTLVTEAKMEQGTYRVIKGNVVL
jgi:hypothetical protein